MLEPLFDEPLFDEHTFDRGGGVRKESGGVTHPPTPPLPPTNRRLREPQQGVLVFFWWVLSVDDAEFVGVPKYFWLRGGVSGSEWSAGGRRESCALVSGSSVPLTALDPRRDLVRTICIAVRQFSIVPFTVWSDDGHETTKDAQILGCHDGQILCRWISEPGCQTVADQREFTIPEGEGMVWDA